MSGPELCLGVSRSGSWWGADPRDGPPNSTGWKPCLPLPPGSGGADPRAGSKEARRRSTGRWRRRWSALVRGEPLPVPAAAGKKKGPSGNMRAWERGYLADPIMSLDGDPVIRVQRDHIHSSKEAARGGRRRGGRWLWLQLGAPDAAGSGSSRRASGAGGERRPRPDGASISGSCTTAESDYRTEVLNRRSSSATISGRRDRSASSSHTTRSRAPPPRGSTPPWMPPASASSAGTIPMAEYEDTRRAASLFLHERLGITFLRWTSATRRSPITSPGAVSLVDSWELFGKRSTFHVGAGILRDNISPINMNEEFTKKSLSLSAG